MLVIRLADIIRPISKDRSITYLLLMTMSVVGT